MGAINPSKMPKAKTIIRKDDPNKVKAFAEGGEVERAFKPTESDYQTRIVGGGGKDDYGMGLGGRTSVTKKLDKDTDIEAYIDAGMFKPKGMGAKGEITGGGIKFTKRFKKGGVAQGLYANIHAKQKRIKEGSGERMRKRGSPGAPTEEAFKKASRSKNRKG